jgi:MerR family transcriptional regulator, light-induced transcriptional regulator
MNDRSRAFTLSMSIAAVERDTGLSKDTLRVWERRYGFPSPERDALGERLYPFEQVEKLRVLRRLMDAGFRPGKVIELPLEALQALSTETLRGTRDGAPALTGAGLDADELQRYVDLLKGHQAGELRRQLSEDQLRRGLQRFVLEVVAPLARMVGEGWVSGRIAIHEEHVFSESVQSILRTSLNGMARPSLEPVVLLTTIPQESHGLGLLMAEAMLALEGCGCVSLGVQTPVSDIVMAAEAHRADVVALSFSGAVNPNQALAALDELRHKLPETVALWAGGASPILRRRPPAGVQVLQSLEDIAPAVTRWRDANPVRQPARRTG